MKRYIIYVDGFNLYYGLKDTKYKWLNLKSLIHSFDFEDCHIVKIRYFTAKVFGRPDDPKIKERQNFYLRALHTIREIEIHYGQFKRREVRGELLEKSSSHYQKTVRISKFEEKGSDVNIATYLMADCLQGRCDVPVLLSNDSDLAEPLKLIKTELKKPVGLITPAGFFAAELKRYSSFRRKITDKQLESSQFPYDLKDKQGSFFCPKEWRP